MDSATDSVLTVNSAGDADLVMKSNDGSESFSIIDGDSAVVFDVDSDGVATIVSLASDPSVALGPATKQYVDQSRGFTFGWEFDSSTTAGDPGS